MLVDIFVQEIEDTEEGFGSPYFVPEDPADEVNKTIDTENFTAILQGTIWSRP